VIGKHGLGHDLRRRGLFLGKALWVTLESGLEPHQRSRLERLSSSMNLRQRAAERSPKVRYSRRRPELLDQPRDTKALFSL
jgi:hypothetical protein